MAPTLRVLTWNVWWRFGNWGERQSAIGKTIRDSAADIIGLQETYPEQAERLAVELDYEVVYSNPTPESSTGMCNAVLSRWAIRDSDQVALPGVGESYRTALMAKIGSPFGPVPVFVTHLDHQFDRSAQRCRQLETVAQFIASHRPSEDLFPPVLLADLNAVPDSDEVRRLTGRSVPFVDGMIFSDAWEQVGSGDGATWCDTNPNCPPQSAWPNRRLDYVMIGWPRPKPTGNPLDGTIIGSRTIDGAVPSDHYGVLVDLSVA